MPVSFNQRDTGPKAQDGKRPGDEGPPDLDQLWRDFNARLTRLFGKRNEGGGGPYRPDARGAGITAAVIGAIALAVWLASGAYIVPDGQVGVVTTFGKFSHTTDAGFNWRWPAPIQAVDTVNTAQVQTAEIGYRANLRNKQLAEALMLTGDDNIVDVQFSVQYKIKQPVAWLFNNRDQVETVRDAAETAVRELVGMNKMDYVLYTGHDQIAAAARGRIQQMIDRYKLGAEIVGVTMQQTAPPDQIAAAFEDAVKAGEERVRARSEAQAYADDIIPLAKAKAARMLQEAEAYRATVENTATGNAARFDKIVAEYAKAPGVTRDRIYLETMQQIYANTSKVMLDTKAGNNTIYLPLDRLLAQSATNDAAIGSRSGPMMAPVQPQAQAAQPQNGPVQQPQTGQMQQAPQQTQAQPPVAAQPDPATPVHRDPRSRDSSRERESR